MSLSFKETPVPWARCLACVDVAQPGGKPKTEFTLTAHAANGATFENPAHGHPKLIRYRLNIEGQLVAELEGAEGPQRFAFKPVTR